MLSIAITALTQENRIFQWDKFFILVKIFSVLVFSSTIVQPCLFSYSLLIQRTPLAGKVGKETRDETLLKVSNRLKKTTKEEINFSSESWFDDFLQQQQKSFQIRIKGYWQPGCVPMGEANRKFQLKRGNSNWKN